MNEKVKTQALIQVRSSSSRLPKKALLPFGNMTAIEFELNRIKQVNPNVLNRMVIVTSAHPSDDFLFEMLSKKGYFVFRGSLDDVLERFYEACLDYPCDNVIRLTGDCPFIDPEIIENTIQFFYNNKSPYVSNIDPPTFPDGMDVEIFNFSQLKEAFHKATLKSDREHVTPYIRRKFPHSPCFKRDPSLEELRLTLDEKNDYDTLISILKILPENFKLHDIVKVISKHPEFLKNSKIVRNEGYLKSLSKD